LKFEFTQSLNLLTIGNTTDPLYPLILWIIRCLVILAVRAWFGVLYEYRITMRECLKGNRGKRVNIFSFRDLNPKHLSTIKFGISRMEFEKLKFGILRMKKFGISEMEFKWENKPSLLLCFNNGIHRYYYVLLMEFMCFLLRRYKFKSKGGRVCIFP